MKSPKKPEDIKDEIRVSISRGYFANSLRYRQLKKLLLLADEEIILDGILQVFEDNSIENRRFKEQTFTGNLLKELNPLANIDLENILKRVLPNYDPSIEELPFYLCDNFGKDEVIKKLNEIDTKDSDILRSIKTFKYWLKAYPLKE